MCKVLRRTKLLLCDHPRATSIQISIAHPCFDVELFLSMTATTLSFVTHVLGLTEHTYLSLPLAQQLA